MKDERIKFVNEIKGRVFEILNSKIVWTLSAKIKWRYVF
jgi:hypothetical protein